MSIANPWARPVQEVPYSTAGSAAGQGNFGFGSSAGTNVDPQNTLWSLYYNQNPDVGYKNYLNKSGWGNPNTMFGNYAHQQYGNLYQNFQASAEDHPIGYSWTDYLRDNGGSLQRQFNNLAPQQRGVHQPGRVRWFGV